MRTRPLSPHLQVYRLPLTALLSISHRLTGVILSVGLLLGAIFLVAVVEGETEFRLVQVVLESWPGTILLWAWIYALFYHLCHGVRHLIWDSVNGLERETLRRDGILELVASVSLTVAVYVFRLLRS